MTDATRLADIKARADAGHLFAPDQIYELLAEIADYMEAADSLGKAVDEKDAEIDVLAASRKGAMADLSEAQAEIERLQAQFAEMKRVYKSGKAKP